MSFSLTFLNYSYLWPVFVVCLIIGAVFIWKEWTTSGQHRLIIKIILSFAVLISLACIILKPAFLGPEKEKIVILLTEHFEQRQLDSLKQAYRKSTVWNYRSIDDLSKVKNASQIFLLGSGLASFDLWQLRETPVTYLPGKEVSGIVKLKYKTQNLTGRDIEISAEYANPTDKHQLILEDASGNALDSITLTFKDNQSLKLSAPLKVPGKFVYSITEIDSTGKVINRNPLPLEVKDAQPLNILILNYYSIFEIKYLKQFLSDLSYKVSVKNRITSGRFKFEFYNQKAKNLSRLNSSILEDFDLIIADAETLRLLPASEQNRIENSVRNEGLGVLILGETSRSRSLDGIFKSAIKSDRTTEVVLDQLPEVKVEKKPFQMESNFGLEPIHSSNSNFISAYKRLGVGRVGITALTNTWQLKLEGSNVAYQQIWSELVEQVSKRSKKNNTWFPQQELSTKDEPFKFKLETSAKLPTVITNNKHQISLRQDLINPRLWSGRTYPQNQGWQELRLEQDSTASYSYFVHGPKDWKTIKAYNNRILNTRMFSGDSKDSASYKSLVAINPLWFFCLFLIGMGGLWIEPKL
jgi:hypothetical protein